MSAIAPTADQVERNRLAVQFRPLAWKIAGRWSRRFPRMATEFESSAMLALVEAARGWDPEACAFSTWAAKAINWDMMTVVNREMRRKEYTCLHNSLGEKGGSLLSSEENPILSILAAPPEHEDLDQVLDNQGDAAAILERFPPDVREIVHRRFWRNQTFDEIGQALGVSGTAVGMRFNRWMAIVRRDLGGEGLGRPGPLAGQP